MLQEQTHPREHGLPIDALVPGGFLDTLRLALDDAGIATAFCDWGCAMLGAQRCSLSYQINRDEMCSHTARAGRSGNVARDHVIAGTLIGDTFMDRTTRVVTNLAQQSYQGCRALAAQGMGTIIAAPLLGEEGCFGVIAVSYRKRRKVRRADVRLVECIAAFLASQMELRQKVAALSHLAQTDPLTGAYNRTVYTERAATLWEDWERLGRPYSIASIDLDHFKLVNDTMGHAVGDAVLCETVNRISAKLRQGDFVLRMGGEEFCVLISGLSAENAAPLVQRLHNAIGGTPIKTPDGMVAVTASIGLTSPNHHDDCCVDVLKRSDQALYAAKAAGRNTIILRQNELLVNATRTGGQSTATRHWAFV